jgi:hypothetical protein
VSVLSERDVAAQVGLAGAWIAGQHRQMARRDTAAAEQVEQSRSGPLASARSRQALEGAIAQLTDARAALGSRELGVGAAWLRVVLRRLHMSVEQLRVYQMRKGSGSKCCSLLHTDSSIRIACMDNAQDTSGQPRPGGSALVRRSLATTGVFQRRDATWSAAAPCSGIAMCRTAGSERVETSQLEGLRK